MCVCNRKSIGVTGIHAFGDNWDNVVGRLTLRFDDLCLGLEKFYESLTIFSSL